MTLRPTAARGRPAALLVAGLLTLVSLAACTKSTGPTGSPSSPAPSTTRASTPVAIPTTPVATGPTTSAERSSCPFISTAALALDVGQRLARITVQSSGGQVVGCTWYPLAHPTAQCGETCYEGEELPPGSQADVKISSLRYATADAAHNAFILRAEKGTNIQRVTVTAGNIGLCYQTAFYQPDAGKDWACTYAVGRRVVLINSVVTDPALNVMKVAQAIASHF